MLNLTGVEALARRAHEGQTDKLGVPYIQHPEAVAFALAPMGVHLEMAGWLHDVIEDTGWTVESLLEAGVPKQAVDLAWKVTKRPGETYMDRIRDLRSSPNAALVKIADNAHNSHPDRLAQLDAATRMRLASKYGRARRVLWSAVDPGDVRMAVDRINPSLLT